MSETEPEAETRIEGGFDFQGHFYPLRVSDMGKDLMLIDRLTGGVSIFDFHDMIEDALERGKGGVLLALIATSIRAERPDWSVDKIVRVVTNLHMSEVEWARREGEEVSPLAQTAADETEPETSPTNGESSTSRSNGSSASPTPPESSPLETWSETPL